MDLQKGDEVWVFDGNMLYTGVIIESISLGYRVRYTSGYARVGDIDVRISDSVFKFPEERDRLITAIQWQEDYLMHTRQDIESGLKL